ncbi:MAG: hypothetical protein RBG13Loki_4173 [Promethearchaeota archaeon CR_4]|nr:MAG: hypothetical protein RBG13Loki_4173 [Candidatus Lokiarchaeota archaeon CR_4]
MPNTKQSRTFKVDGPQLDKFPHIEIPLASRTETAVIHHKEGTTEVKIPDDDQDKEKAIYITSGIVTSFRLQKPGWIGFEFLPYIQPPEDLKDPFIIDNETERDEIRERYKNIEEIVLNRDLNDPIFRLALRRFNRSYNDEFKEDILIDLMICFETLFIRARESPKSGCLKCRVGSFLEYKDFINSSKISTVENDFERASRLRNCVVHEGKQYDLLFERYNRAIQRYPGTPWDFLLKLREYARFSLQGYIKCVTTGNCPTTSAVKIKICNKWYPPNQRLDRNGFLC